MPYKDKTKQQEFQKQWLRKRRQKWIDEHGPCIDCGSKNNLEIDHIDPETKDPALRLGSGKMWGWAKEKLDKELLKCVVRCRSCHLQKTRNEYFTKLIHGVSRSLYDKYGCRCKPCKELHSTHLKAHRKHKKNSAPVA